MPTRLAIRYVLGEMIPTFFLGVIVFVFILLMFQALRLTEFVLVHGVKVTAVAELVAYMSTSFLPILFPMSLLFTIILTYGRLSSDSEIVAFKASGMSMWEIITPAIFLSVLIGLLSAQMAFHIAPWGNRQFELMITKIGAMKPSVSVKEGTFSEGFFDLVLYSNQVDQKTGELGNVFIYDERNVDSPMIVIARRGILQVDEEKPGESAALLLTRGSVHRTAGGRHTKVDFKTYKLLFSSPSSEDFKKKSPQSLTLNDINDGLKDPDTSKEDRLTFKIEFHKRLAISFACVLFAMLGVGFGTTTNKRTVKSGGMVMSLVFIVCYWVLYITGENLAQSGKLPPGLAMWLANILFAIAGVYALRRSWN